MHLEILVEGQSERTALEPILSKILGTYNSPHTWRIHKHQGIGKLPVDIEATPNRADRSLLHNLPSRLRAYGKSLNDEQVVLVLLDLDNHPSKSDFENELKAVLAKCDPTLPCTFTFAVEELEAWYLGDQAALTKAYPNADLNILKQYVQDSQCGTWEVLADIIYPGGSKELKKLGVQKLEQKRIWARDIAPNMDVATNQSPSFKAFRTAVRRISKSKKATVKAISKAKRK